MLDDNRNTAEDGMEVEDVPLNQRLSRDAEKPEDDVQIKLETVGAERPEDVHIKVECPDAVSNDTPTTSNSRRTRSLNKSINVSPIKARLFFTFIQIKISSFY